MGAATGVSAGLGLIGTGLSVYGTLEAARDEQAINEWNAGVADLQAADTIRRGQLDETKSRIATRGLIGSQRVALAANGVQVGDPGSTGDLLQIDSARIGEEDALTIRNNAARQAWGYQVEATNYRRQGAAAVRRGRLSAASQLLSGGAQTTATLAKA